MLVTSLYWRLNGGDHVLLLVTKNMLMTFFCMLVTPECEVGDRYLMLGPNSCWQIKSSTSQTCLQHIWSPKYVTNIDVTLENQKHLNLPYLKRVEILEINWCE